MRSLMVVEEGSLIGIRYRDKIVRQHVTLFIRTNQYNVILQQDNGGPHTARVVSDYLRQQNVNVLPWPVMSPELSPHSTYLGRNGTTVASSALTPATVDAFCHSLIRIWRNIPQALLNTVNVEIFACGIIFTFFALLSARKLPPRENKTHMPS